MANYTEPQIGVWYKDLVDKRMFEVVAIDEDAGTIDIQYFESDIQEYDYETWKKLDLEEIPPPEDWSGPYEFDGDDMGLTDIIIHPESRTDPLDEIDSQGFDDQIDSGKEDK